MSPNGNVPLGEMIPDEIQTQADILRRLDSVVITRAIVRLAAFRSFQAAIDPIQSVLPRVSTMQVDPDHLRKVNGHARPDASRIDKLCEHLRKDRYIRVALGYLEKIGGAHMKDLTMNGCDAQRVSVMEGRDVVSFGSGSFLGLDFDPRLQEAVGRAAKQWGVHQYSSRSFYSMEPYDHIERRLADWLGVEDTLVFPCVTKLHAGVIPSLAGRGDVLAVDRFSHNSIWEASKIAAASGAEVREFDADNPSMLESVCQRKEGANCVVIVDGVYSMTGEVPRLDELDAEAKKAGAILYVDDAHGTGVVGPGGRGSSFERLGGIGDTLYIGSLSKAFASLGGFITCSPALKLMLKMKANTYIFSGPIPAPYLEVMDEVLNIIELPEYEVRLQELHGRIRRFTDGLDDAGIQYRGGLGPIVSIVVGDIEKTLAAGRRFFELGYFVPSVTYPAVPLNGGLLRCQINANHSLDAIDGFLDAVRQVSEELSFAALQGVA